MLACAFPTQHLIHQTFSTDGFAVTDASKLLSKSVVVIILNIGNIFDQPNLRTN